MTRLLHFIRPRAAWRSAVLLAIIAAGCAQVPAPGLPAGAASKAASPVNACDAAAQVNPAASGATVAGRPGLGGTGIDTGGVGGTGIVGVITGFASVCVNGVEVHYDQSTPVASNGALSTASQLAVGQVVLIAAQGQGAQLTARSINAVYAVVGPVQSLDAKQGTLQVMGQQLVDATAREMGRVQPGQWVQASGHRLANGAVALTSLEPIAALDQARLNGRITRIEPDAVVVEGTRVALGAQPLPAGAAVGMELSVSGVWDGTQLQGQRLDAEPTRKALGSAERVVLQGYVQGLRGSELNLGYSMVTLGANMQIVGGGKQGLAVNQRVQISGRMGSDRRLTADRVEVQSSGSNSGSGKGNGRRGGDDSGSSRSGDDSGKNSGSDSSNSGKGSSGSDSGSGSNSGSDSGSGSSGKGSSGGGGSSGGSSGGSGGGGSSGGGSSGGSSGGGGSGGGGSGRGGGGGK